MGLKVILPIIIAVVMFGIVQASCGNSILETGEKCDAGAQNGVPCSVSTYNGQCNFCTSNCLIATLYGPYCGDRSRNGNEQCDDGNTVSGDGCSSTCMFEPRCGNGIVQPGEQCDKGSLNGILCSAGYGESCKYCTTSCMDKIIGGQRCGDGTLQSQYEQCDDGNNVNGDGCSSTCIIENIQPVCGNHIKEAGEQCDDGNNVNGDGCSSTCIIETPLPSCGDNIINNGEQCDNGNLNGRKCDNSNKDCEYCSSSCKVVELKENNNDDDSTNKRVTLSSFNLCNPIWQCSNWGECIDGIQYRNCKDINNCENVFNKPAIAMGCEIQKAIGIEGKSGTTGEFNWLWILLAVLIIVILIVILLMKMFG